MEVAGAIPPSTPSFFHAIMVTMSASAYSLLVFAALATLAASAIHKVEFYHGESRLENAIRQGKMKEYHAKRELSRLYHKSKDKGKGKVISQNVRDFDDFEYIANITVGTPDQSFSVVVDTGSAELWLPDSSCSSESKCNKRCIDDLKYCNYVCDNFCCADDTDDGEDSDDNDDSNVSFYFDRYTAVRAQSKPKKHAVTCNWKLKFYSNMSRTYVNDSRDFAAGFDIGIGFAEGFLGKDTVRFGAAGTKQLVIPKTIFGQATTISRDFRNSNADGVFGLARKAANGVDSPIMNAINQNLLDQPIFTVYLDRQAPEGSSRAGGTFTFGGLDNDNCHGVVGYAPFSSDTRYQFTISGVKVGKKFKQSRKMDAIVSTGTPFLLGPHKLIKKIGDSVGAMYEPQTRLYVIECNLKYDPITLKINGKHYQLTKREMTLSYQIRPGICVFGALDSDYVGAGVDWVLGTPFQRAYCNVHDIGNSRIGFAPVK